jgi:DUF4097 and DUF4098 domain-containing protein YvlB
VWFVLLAALMGVAQLSDRMTRVIDLPADKPLSIEITIGTVRIIGSDRKDVSIVVERRAPTSEALLKMPLFIDDKPDRVHVMAQQFDNGTDPALRADVTVRVPRAALIDSVKVMEGRIVVEQFSGSLTADIRRGPVEGKDLSGKLRFSTEIGDVTLTNARLSPDGLLRLRTFNGDVTLTLAQRPTDARIMALALNGHVKSDIPLTHRNTWGPRWAEATLGRGEPVISIDVVTGTVEIKSP